jgi:hypothetical protein
MPNDYVRYPDDAPEQMKRFANNMTSFLDVVDETQEVARAYGAVCTPEFFGFNAEMQLRIEAVSIRRGRRSFPMPAASCSR